MNHPELSVVMLCYRAGEPIRNSIREVYTLLKQEVPNFELILVANYDRDEDRTPLIVKEMAGTDPKIRYSAVAKQGMMGWDMKTGLALAHGNYIAIIDGDGQMPFEDIPRLYKKVIEARADMGKTFRTIRGDNVWRKVVSYVFNIIFSILFPGLHIKDVNSKPKILSRRAYEQLALLSDDWFIDAEMMIQARRHNFTIVQIPTVFKKLKGRKSFVRMHTIIEFLKNLTTFRIKEWNEK
jgi:glycosyltransferase involved in cell wall biosynthesis